jgi:uncharacterized protein YlxW (UPF0749 family)
MPEDAARFRRLRADLSEARELVAHLAALVDHYENAYRDSQDQLKLRERELAELRRSTGVARLRG